MTIFLTDSDTSLLENLCALTLYRAWKGGEGEKVWFYNKEVELDFYLADSRRGIQACYSLADPATEEREMRALVRFHELYGLQEAEIVTWSEERIIERGNLSIKVIPLLKWLLSIL